MSQNPGQSQGMEALLQRIRNTLGNDPQAMQNMLGELAQNDPQLLQVFCKKYIFSFFFKKNENKRQKGERTPFSLIFLLI